MKQLAALMIAALLAGCGATAQNVSTAPRVVEVPSSKPFKFIKWSVADTEDTKRDVRAHNRALQAVIDEEKKSRTARP